jgi:hypothetical protein
LVSSAGKSLSIYRRNICVAKSERNTVPKLLTLRYLAFFVFFFEEVYDFIDSVLAFLVVLYKNLTCFFEIAGNSSSQPTELYECSETFRPVPEYENQAMNEADGYHE